MTIPQSALGRTGRMLFSGAKMLSHELAGRLSGDPSMVKQRVKQAQELVLLLGELKGAALKGGQIFSQEFGDLLPKEVLAILRKLQDDTAFMPIDQVRYIIARQLGAEKLSDLVGLSEIPIAAASIGQVHRATLNGVPVAVKVQYPGVAKSIDADLATLRRLVQLTLQIQGSQIDLEPIFKELVINLKRECDYRLEADAIAHYTAVFTDQRFVIPSVFTSYSSEQVLTLSFEEGMRITSWMQSSPSVEEQTYVGDAIIDLTISEFLQTGVVQSDPNLGNFLYRPADRKIVLLDFGATIVMTPLMREQFTDIVFLAADGDVAGAISYIEGTGMLSGKESAEAKLLFERISRHLAQIVQPACQPFDFSNAVWQQEVRSLSTKLGLALKHTPPPEQILLLFRKLGGMLSLVRDLQVPLDIAQKVAALR